MGGDSHAVVLAAGLGRRLRPLTEDTPKTLLDVDEKPILDHITDALAATGYEDLTVVTGFEEAQIRANLVGHDDLSVSFVHSDRFRETNNLYSLWLARDRIEDGFTLVNSDTMFPRSALDRLRSEDGSALVVDAEKDLGEEEMKVDTVDGTVVDIGKEVDGATGEYIGVCKFDERGARRVVEALDRFVDEGRVNEWYEAAFRKTLDDIDVGVVPVGDDWIEIDDSADLQRARQMWQARTIPE